MKKKKKGLVITYCFPPLPSPESFITSKLVYGLSEKIDLDILTLEYKKSDKVEINLNKFFKTKIRIIRIKIPRIVEILLNLPRLPIRPDRFLLLYPIFKLKLKNEIKLDEYDFFFTRSQFHSTHLLGLYLKKKYPMIPWITSFSDPWKNNPVQKYIPLFESISNFLQDKVLKKADCLIFPIKELQLFFQKLVEFDITNKSLIVPHTYFPKLYKKIKIKKKNQNFKIRYFGKIYANRNIFPFLEAIKNLKDKGLTFDVELYLDNDFRKNNFKIIKKYSNIISFNRYVKPLKYIDLLHSADLLILLDVDEDFGNLFFQSKLVDYIGSENKILHIGKSNTFNKKLILKNNCFSSLNDPTSLQEILIKILNSKKEFLPNKKLIDKYRLEKVSLDLSYALDKITSNVKKNP